MSKGRVVVGMSGGVDSSVAAYLLKEQGYDVIGVTMRTLPAEDRRGVFGTGGSSAAAACWDAKRVADTLGIPHYVIDYEKEFCDNVIEKFVSEYRAGRTPNPCIVCNRSVKWESMLRCGREFGADAVATGHYASIVRLANGRYTLKMARSADGRSKDQTYALYRLTQEQLSRTIMPCGEYMKEEIRDMALRAGLPVAAKPDSEDICFVPDKDYAGFIERYTGVKDLPGYFVDDEGNVLGSHRGITRYTVGQRKHLGIALGRPAYVSRIRAEANEVVISDNNSLFTHVLMANDLNFMSESGIIGKELAVVKIRYNHGGASAIIEMVDKDCVRCVFDEPQRAVTPGQAAVFYRDGYVLGGGTIVC